MFYFYCLATPCTTPVRRPTPPGRGGASSPTRYKVDDTAGPPGSADPGVVPYNRERRYKRDAANLRLRRRQRATPSLQATVGGCVLTNESTTFSYSVLRFNAIQHDSTESHRDWTETRRRLQAAAGSAHWALCQGTRRTTLGVDLESRHLSSSTSWTKRSADVDDDQHRRHLRLRN